MALGGGGLFPGGVKLPGREAGHSPTSSTETKMSVGVLPLPAYAFEVYAGTLRCNMLNAVGGQVAERTIFHFEYVCTTLDLWSVRW